MYSGPMKQRSPESEGSVFARIVSSNFAPGQPQVVVDASIWAMFTFSTLFITLRFYCRLVRSGRLLPDDYVLAAGWVCMLASASLLTKLMSLGFMDTSFNPDQIILFLRSSQTCNMVALSLTKTSFAVTLIPITREWKRYLVWFIIGSISLAFIIHSILLWRPMCLATSSYDLPVSCWDATRAVILNIFSSLYSSLADFVLALLPWRVLMDLQMKRSEKISVAVGMSFGIIAGITGVVKVVRSATTLDFNASDFQYNLISFWIFSLAEPNATLVAACVPVLRVMFRDAKTTYYRSKSPSTGGYIRPTNHNTGAFAAKDPNFVDTRSERRILDGGIIRTREIAIDFDEDRSFEMWEHSPAQKHSRVSHKTHL
ncbi:hypothetical protein PG985_016149 [Apiospora marii]